MPRVGLHRRTPLVKTITVQIGAQTAKFSLEKESLINRKLAIMQMETLRNAAKVCLWREAKSEAPLPVDGSFPGDFEIPVLSFRGDSIDEWDFDSECSGPFLQHIVTIETDDNPTESNTNKGRH
jgi:hypothetical protein